MRTLLLAAAIVAAAVPAAGAAAQRLSGPGSGGAISHSPVRVHRGFDAGDEWRRDRDHRRGHLARGYWGYRDYQGDTLWRPDSFNDWWHERPRRSYPAWVARNLDCERLWWSGGDWRC